MSIMATLLRFFVIIAFAVTVGLPSAHARADAPHAAAMASHEACHTSAPGHPGQPLPQDEICRAHCLGLSMFPGAAAPAPHGTRDIALPVQRFAEIAPSLWPLPEPHPPRL